MTKICNCELHIHTQRSLPILILCVSENGLDYTEGKLPSLRDLIQKGLSWSSSLPNTGH